MADSKLSALPALTTPASNDLLYVVDVSDTTDAASGTSKAITTKALGVPFVATTEVDFGSSPLSDKTFTITDANVASTSTIFASLSTTPATGGYGNDAEWDVFGFAATPGQRY